MKHMKVCNCGRRIEFTSICPCKTNNEAKNKYQRNYYEKNKEILKPLNSIRWKKLRALVIKRDNGCCQRCLIKFKIINGLNLQVHHIKPRIDHPELIFEESNLITMCKTCNLQIGLKELDFEPAIELDEFDFDLKL